VSGRTVSSPHVEYLSIFTHLYFVLPRDSIKSPSAECRSPGISWGDSDLVGAGSVRLRVLFVEDSPERAQLIARRLSDAGYDVDSTLVNSAETLNEALERQTWDLVISAFSLRNLSGFDALVVWQQKACSAPFVFISRILQEQAALEAREKSGSEDLLNRNSSSPILLQESPVGRSNQRKEREYRQQNVKIVDSVARFRALTIDYSDRILVDQRGSVVFCSSAVCRILGYEPAELIGLNFLDLTYPDDRRRAETALHECRATRAKSVRFRIRHKNGSWRIIDCVCSRLLGEPAVDVLVINFWNVAEQSLSEETLRKSEEKFSKAFRSSPLAMTISTKDEGRYLDVNDAFLRMFGYERGEVIGKSSVQLGIWAKPEQRDPFLRTLRDPHSRVTGFHAAFKTKSGEILETEVAAEPIELGGDACILAITKDVTETKRLEAQNRHAQKMEAVGQLAGGVAHDFNNLLMVMRSYAQMIEAETTEPKLQEYTRRIVEASDKAASVTRQLLAFSRRQPQELKQLDLNRATREFCAVLPRLIGENIEVQVSTPAKSATVFADQSQIEQVIMNLALNARDAMPSGGRLTIETTEAELGIIASEHHGARISPGHYVVLTVTDSGSGIDEETRARIFEPFFTTKDIGKGTGLGLATVYGIVKQHKGYIWVYSEVGIGTAFKIYLPQWRGSHRDEPSGSQASDNFAVGHQTILLVEDQPALIGVIAEYLSLNGYIVLKARNAQSAMQIAGSYSATIHVLLTDIVMPGQRGPELARILGHIHPETKIMYMSGYPQSALDDVEGAVVIQKPVDLAKLTEKIRRVLNGRMGNP
jgi:two-component system, cell cycle sensor histidine kinase and response regulator CckA